MAPSTLSLVATASDFFVDTPNRYLYEWIKPRINLIWSDDFRALARVKNGKIVGCVCYEGFTGTSCRIHMAGDGPGWMNRKFIRLAFRYPFEVLGLSMVFGVVPSGNTVALSIDKRLGFKELLYVEGAHPDGGLHFLQLKQDDWARSIYGRQST